MEFSLDSAFYVFNLVANFAYSRWDLIYADVYSAIIAKENLYFSLVAEADAKAISMFNENQMQEGVEYLTSFSYELGDALVKDWFTFFGQLFVKYRDGYITTAAPEVPVCGCQSASAPYQDQWYDRIVEDTGETYLMPQEDEAQFKRTTRKLDLRAFN